MPRIELMEQAKALYQEGKTPSEIAELLGVSPGTVRSWKSRGGWGDNAATQRNVAKERCNTALADIKTVKAVEDNNELTDAQKAFCLYYSKTFNATMAYKKAYGCSYETANAEGPRALVKHSIRAEITRLKEIRSAALLASVEDVVEKYMHIAFADITDFLEFGRALVPVMGPFGPIQIPVPGSDAKIALTKEINEVRFKESFEVDGTLLSEVKQGKDGASVKLADRMKALEWLGNYFEANPSDRHRREYDQRRLEIDLLKAQASIKETGEQTIPDDGFNTAMDSQAETIWVDGDNSDPDWRAPDNVEED
ncbi:MAG: terminase small subunit [Clostridium sp.]|uniref:terminase small subunit n=1 Tax=Clostridium sp. TaxID=1506 RepID=UPI00290802F2|nr:terminase small subunit [Clostridium sp.]MDU7338598.1 terminase small subunit [Clostridium sp.]